MKKFLSFFAALIFAVAANAAVINITNETPDALRLALNSANNYDEIVMAAGTYVESNGNYIAIDGKEVFIKAAEGAEVIIQPQVPITISNGGVATFENVKIDASRLTELADYEHLIYAADGAINGLKLKGCELYGFTLNKSMIYCGSANKFAGITIDNCYFHDIEKSILFIENTAKTMSAQIKNSTFENIVAHVTDSYWAGIIDIRATEALITFDKCTFYNVIPMNTDYSAVSKVTLTKGTVSNCIFMLPTAQDGIRAMRGVAATNCITYNYLKDSGTGIHSSVTQTNCVQADPLFVDAANGNFTLGEGSPALTMNDGQPIGDPRWVPADEPEEEHTYTLAGSSSAAFGTAWDPTNTANDMLMQTDGMYVWEKEDVELVAGVIEFKVCQDHSWDNCWPTENYSLTIEESGIYTISIAFDSESKNISASATKTEEACNWENIEWVAGSNNKFKVCANNSAINIVNVQHPGFADEDGIYMTFPSAAFGAISLPSDKYAIDGAGMVLYLSAFELKETVVSVTCSDVEYIFTVFNADGKDAIYTVAGSSLSLFGTLWDPTNSNNNMIEDNGLYKLEKTDVTLSDGEITFKVTLNHSWDNSWPVDNYSLTIEEGGIYTISITFDPESEDVTALATKTGEAIVLPVINMHGTFTGAWLDTELFEVAADSKSASLTITIDEVGDYEFGMRKDGTWTANGASFTRANASAEVVAGSGNLTLNVDVVGEYTFTWTFETNTLSIEYPELPLVYCELPAGHQMDANFGDPSARILLTLRKAGNNVVVSIKNNTEAGNPRSGLNFLWVNAQGSTGVVRYGNGTHEAEDVEEVSVIVEFNEAQENYVFTNIHWAYSGWDGEWAIDGLNVQASELCDELVLENGYYLVGSFGGVEQWSVADLTAADLFAANDDAQGEYMIEATLAEGDEFKAVYVKNDQILSWYPAEGGNYIVTGAQAGDVTIYFRPEGNESWGGCFYVNVEEETPSAISNITTEATVKMIQDGQFFIIRNGEKFNAQGQVIR